MWLFVNNISELNWVECYSPIKENIKSMINRHNLSVLSQVIFEREFYPIWEFIAYNLYQRVQIKETL